MPGSLLLRLFGLGRPTPARPAGPPKRGRRARKRPRPRDFQRARVYRWEAQHVFPHGGAGERLSLDACRALVEDAYRWREAPRGGDRAWRPPEVTDGRGRRHACGSREVIKLPRWARTRAVVLHECAHGMSDDGHGPGFVGVYVELLEAFAQLNRRHMIETLATSNIKT